MSVFRSVSKCVLPSVHRASSRPAALMGGAGPNYRAETLAYQTRVEAAGGTMTDDGLAMVDAIFSNAATQGITLQRGYVFGTAVNLPAANRTALELTGNGQSLVADTASADSVITCGLGSLCLSGNSGGVGYLKTSSESLFDNTDWTILVYYQKPIVDSSGTAGATVILSQYNTFASGRFYLIADQSNAVAFTAISGTSVAARGTAYAGGATIEPGAFFITYNATTRELKMYDPVSQAFLGSAGAMPSGGFTALATYLGNTAAATFRARTAAYMGVLKYSGVLTSAQMISAWDSFFAAHCKLIDRAWLIGNSVTSGSDSQEGGSQGANNWGQKFSVSAVQNNCLVIRPNSMGGKQIYYFRPSDYTSPPVGSSVPLTPPYSAIDSVDTWKKWKPNILVCDENQNTAANYSHLVDYEIDYADLLDAIKADLEEALSGIDTVKIVAGTMLAVGADGNTYAQIITLEASNNFWRKNLRDWSALIRADEGTRFAAVYDLYTEFNLGWDAGSDGNAADPTNDYPNGNPAYFYDDAQHPNNAGHTIMATGYWNAVASVKAH